MESTAIVVLPVWRSPIINSRCPLPIGTKLSTHLTPVCMGSWTLLRGIIPGAFTSIEINFFAFNCPFPSNGFPKGSKIRPNKLAPTGNCNKLPDAETFSPSLIFLSSPKITTWIVSKFKFNASPLIFASINSTTSPAFTLVKPYTVATPSLTFKTLPISFLD